MKKLMPHLHQVAGAQFLAARYHALLGDDPGLEKTYTLTLACEAINAQKILVTCPASVRTHWFETMEMGRGHTRGLTVLSYNAASNEKWRATVPDKVDVWIGDEAHFLKTLTSQRTKALFGNGTLGLARRARYKWPATGTWAPNHRPVELYPVLRALHPEFAKMDFATYANRYCGAYWDGRQLNTKGASRIDELERMLQGFMLRRTEAEVYPDRAEPLFHRIPVELSVSDLNAVIAEEDKIGGRVARLSSSFDKNTQLGDTSRLLRLLGLAKVRQVGAFVKDLLETVDKVVVFAHHRDVVEALMVDLYQAGMKPVRYVGGMSDEQKDNAKRIFAQDDCRAFIGQDDTAGTGVDGLQRVCNTAVFAEWDWTPGDTRQRIKRLARTGQREKLVNAYMLYAKGTLDAVQVNVHDVKERVGDRLVLSTASHDAPRYAQFGDLTQ